MNYNDLIWVFWVNFPDQRWHTLVVYVIRGRHTERHLQSNRSTVQESMPRQCRIISQRNDSIFNTQFGKAHSLSPSSMTSSGTKNSFIRLQHMELPLYVPVTSVCCVNIHQMMVATKSQRILRIRWDGVEDRDFSLDLKRIPFSINQQVSYGECQMEFLSWPEQSLMVQRNFQRENFPIDRYSGADCGEQHVCDDDGVFAADWRICHCIEWWTSGLFDSQFIEVRSKRKSIQIQRMSLHSFLTFFSLRRLQQVQGIWAPGLEDATCTSINHKYRLIAFGRKKWVESALELGLHNLNRRRFHFSSQAVVYVIDDVTGGLEISHTIVLSAKDFPGSPGHVREMKWTPDGCAVMLSWSKGGISLWSTFGTMLMCSLGWDYGLHVDLATRNPLDITCMDWSTEGYQLFMLREQKIFAAAAEDEQQKSDTEGEPKPKAANQNQKPKLMHTYSNQSDKSATATAEPPHSIRTTLVQMEFVKSSFSMNPSMVSPIGKYDDEIWI